MWAMGEYERIEVWSRSMDSRIRVDSRYVHIHIYYVYTYVYNRLIALNWDVHAMPRACSSAEILHGVPKHYKTSPSATICKFVLTISSIPVSVFFSYQCTPLLSNRALFLEMRLFR
ncbi:hypothetical protein P5V15_004775 [Pogonomyrmex californicus]